MTEILPGEYQTKDIYIASTLIAVGYNNYRIEKNDRQFTFIFDYLKEELPKSLSDTDILTVVDEYWKCSLLIDPKSLFNAFKELKNRMYGGEL